jgi:hypothetical protein
MKKAVTTLVLGMALAGALWYLRDPAWLQGMSSGLRPWEQSEGRRYRWSGGHASFFVPSGATAIDMPIATTFTADDSRPMIVSVTIDDEPAGAIILRDPEWVTVHLPLPPPGSRRVRRIDVRTSITREDNHGVKIGEVQVVRAPVAAGLQQNPGARRGAAHAG